VSERHKHGEIDSRSAEFMANEMSKPFGWDPAHFVEWAAVATMIAWRGVEPGARILDVGCGVGWTTLFLAEQGMKPLGVDLVPANIEAARERAQKWDSEARFEVADVESLDLADEPPFDAVLVLHALHHVSRQRRALRAISGHMRPGAVLFVGEPSWLHQFSPRAARARREFGWLERGLTTRGLKRDLTDAGFEDIQRFHQGSHAYRGLGGLARELTGLASSHFVAAPRHQLWITALRS
jgi:2-polyprenyl-3-methyl-5-hydroxy-6-metoxy-1,4-benzoquinol methylase